MNPFGEKLALELRPKQLWLDARARAACDMMKAGTMSRTETLRASNEAIAGEFGGPLVFLDGTVATAEVSVWASYFAVKRERSDK